MHYQRGDESQTLVVGSARWFEWLPGAATFAYSGPGGTFTARQETSGSQASARYWKAYRHRNGKLYRAYLGKSAELTQARLDEIALKLASRSDEADNLPADDSSKKIIQFNPAAKQAVPTVTASPAGQEVLLTTKFFKPFLPNNLIARPRLTALLQEVGPNCKLVLISAPAGFGKTTLVVEWLAATGQEAAWLSLDPADSEPARFWKYLGAGLAALQPDLFQDDHVFVSSSLIFGFEQALTHLINKLAQLPRPVTLVLDDYHMIESETIQQQIAFLLERLPRQLRLVITSRVDPPWNLLPRMLVRGEMVEVRAADLRFTAQEAARFLSQALNVTLSVEDIEELERRTEGWIAALQLASLAFKGRLNTPAARPAELINAFKGSHHLVLNYLTEEVLKQQSPDLQQFLLQTSILDRLSAPLVEELTDCADGQALLERLEQANLFLVSLDQEKTWYRYHPLFKEYLFQRLQKSMPDQLARLNHLAAQWLEEAGLLDEAIGHALAEPDYEFAANLIEREGSLALMRGEIETLQNWLKALPGDMVQGQPGLYLLQAWLFTIKGQVGPAVRLIEAYPALFSEEVNRDTATEINAIRAVNALQQADFEQLGALAQLDFSGGGRAWEGLGLLMQGFNLETQGEVAKSLVYYRQAVQLSTKKGQLLVTLIANCQMADQLLEKGQLREAARSYKLALELIRPSKQASLSFFWRCLPLMGLGQVCYEWNKLDEARQYLEEAVQLFQEFDNDLLLTVICLLLIPVKFAQGDVQGAMETLRLAVQKGMSLQSPIFVNYAGVIKARFWLRQGMMDKLAEWAHNFEAERNMKYDVPPSLADKIRGTQEIIYARYLLVTGQPQAALKVLEPLLDAFEMVGRNSLGLETLEIQAQAYYALNDRPTALALLKKALTLGEPEGYFRVFLDDTPALNPLLKELARLPANELGCSPAYLQRLLDAANIEPVEQPVVSLKSSEPQVELAEPLTGRELAVLRLLNSPLSTPEIGRELVVAASTVRSHVKNIYAKLGVQNRQQAVELARKLGLL